MRQRRAIGRAFLHDPELLLLDEPFTSLDDKAIAVLQSMLQEMRNRGRTVIMSTHQLREAMEAFDARHLHSARAGRVLGRSGRRKCSPIPAGSTGPTANNDLPEANLDHRLQDLRSEIRTKEAFNTSIAFSMVILVLFSFAFDQAEDFQALLGGLLWLVYAFAGALVLNRGFARELQNDCLDALISLARALERCVLGQGVRQLCSPAGSGTGISGSVLSSLRCASFRKLGLLTLVTVLATWAMTVIGTTFSALTVNVTMRELMLPVLIYPFLVPVLMSAMILTTDVIAGVPLETNLIWLRVLVAFDIVFTAITVVFIDVVLVG